MERTLLPSTRAAITAVCFSILSFFMDLALSRCYSLKWWRIGVSNPTAPDVKPGPVTITSPSVQPPPGLPAKAAGWGLLSAEGE